MHTHILHKSTKDTSLQAEPHAYTHIRLPLAHTSHTHPSPRLQLHMTAYAQHNTTTLPCLCPQQPSQSPPHRKSQLKRKQTESQQKNKTKGLVTSSWRKQINSGGPRRPHPGIFPFLPCIQYPKHPPTETKTHTPNPKTRDSDQSTAWASPT